MFLSAKCRLVKAPGCMGDLCWISILRTTRVIFQRILLFASSLKDSNEFSDPAKNQHEFPVMLTFSEYCFRKSLKAQYCINTTRN